MITRRELFEELKKNPKITPGKTQFGSEAFKILYALHRSHFETHGLFLNEDTFKSNPVVSASVNAFNKGSGERYRKNQSKFVSKYRKQDQEWFSKTLDFTGEKNNFFKPFIVQDVPKPDQESVRNYMNQMEADRICQTVSSDEVLILATTQAFRQRNHEASAFVLEAIKDDENLALKLKLFIEDYRS